MRRSTSSNFFAARAVLFWSEDKALIVEFVGRLFDITSSLLTICRTGRRAAGAEQRAQPRQQYTGNSLGRSARQTADLPVSSRVGRSIELRNCMNTFDPAGLHDVSPRLHDLFGKPLYTFFRIMLAVRTISVTIKPVPKDCPASAQPTPLDGLCPPEEPIPQRPPPTNRIWRQFAGNKA